MPADLREIETAFSKIKVHGGRMSEKHMREVDPNSVSSGAAAVRF
jgi:hypothetical protein